MPPNALVNTKDRADLSQFLVHLTKDGTYDHFEAKPGPPPGFERVYRPVRAKDSLIEILTNRRIEARSPFGYFKLKINMYRAAYGTVFRNDDADPSWIKATCFSEAPLSELSEFYKTVHNKRNKYKKYGLAFPQERLRELGGNPIFYVDSRRPDLLAVLDSSLRNNRASFIPMMHLIETFGPPAVQAAGGYSDFRWEREWRKKDNLDFIYSDLGFGICPADEIQYFTQMTNGEVTFIDPDWNEATLQAYLAANDPDLLAQL